MKLRGGIICYAAGVAIAPLLYWFKLFTILPFLLALLVLPARRNRFYPAVIAIFLLLCGFNSYYLAIHTEIPPQLQKRITERESLLLEGTIRNLNSRPESGLSIDLDSITISHREKPLPLSGSVRISVDKVDDMLLPGDRVRLQSRLRLPRNFANPGNFDYVRYLARRRIIATGYIGKTADIAVVQRSTANNPVAGIKRWRSDLRQKISSNITNGAASLVNALTIGDRGALTPDQRSLLSQTGLSHLFAISGLHLGLVATFLYLIARALYLRLPLPINKPPPRRLLPLLLVPFLCGYLILTGSAISTLRALVMLSAAALLCGISRRSKPLDILAAAAFIILLLDPLALFEPSFQLSFAGAGGIIGLLPLWQPRLSGQPVWVRYPLGLLAVNLSATVATMPLVLMHFHLIAPAGPLLNMLAIPLVSLAVIPIILIGTLADLLAPGISIYLFKIAATLLENFLSLCETLLSYETLGARFLYLSPFETGLTFLLTVAVLLFHQRLRGITVAVVVFAGLLAAAPLASRSIDNLTVTALDVGQGDATLLQLPGGESYLIDGGGLYGDRFDVGERLLAPALGYLGVSKLDAVILTHDHPDHRKGLIHILKHFPVGEFWSSQPHNELHPSLKKVLAITGTPAKLFTPGWTPVKSRHGQMQVFVAEGAVRPNDRSLVVYARDKSNGVLLTGDLEKSGISSLVARPSPGPVNLLKIPHHGSRRSHPGPLLQKFIPEISFVSVGFNNRYRHPHPAVLQSIGHFTNRFFRTDRHGAIRFESDDDNWAITHWKKGLFR